MTGVSDCGTPLTATFRIKLNGQAVSITTVGQAYDFITRLGSVEWMEFRSLHADAIKALESASDDAILTGQATVALRMLFGRAKLLLSRYQSLSGSDCIRTGSSVCLDVFSSRELVAASLGSALAAGHQTQSRFHRVLEFGLEPMHARI